MPHVTLILGGVRSGKSTIAEKMAQGGQRVLFVATAEALDEEMERRIAAHRKSRPPQWDTLEEPIDLIDALSPHLNRYDIFLLDCLTLWVSNLLLENKRHADVERIIVEAAGRLLDMIDSTHAAWILVSNEVGFGIVPASPLGRLYRDSLGRVNQLIASRADRVRLMVAGRSLDLHPPSP